MEHQKVDVVYAAEQTTCPVDHDVDEAPLTLDTTNIKLEELPAADLLTLQMDCVEEDAVQVKLEHQPESLEDHTSCDMSRDPKIEPEEEEDVQVIYLNVSDTEALDIGTLLAQQGIQVVDQTEIQTIEGRDESDIFHGQDIVIEATNDGTGNITVVAASQSETQSAQALLKLAKVQDGSSVQVSEILAANREIVEDEQGKNSSKALLQLAAEQNAGTYIVDDNGTMIPLTDVTGENLLNAEVSGVTTIAICQCFCGQEFISQEDLEKHKRFNHEGSPTKSKEKSVIEKKTLETCSLCRVKMPTSKLSQHHKEYHPGEMPWQCSICQKRYHKKVAMKAHMRAHNTLAKYQCSTCKKVFFYKSAMQRHIKQHACDKPFKCTICGDMLNTLWELRKHRTHHQARSLYSCDVCFKDFKQKATLVVHSRIHSGLKPYTCEICNKSFSLKTTLTQHRRIHTGEKPNVCPICNQSFRQASTMQSHMKRHTHEKPHICRYCRVRFAFKDELDDHELEHGQNKKWQCDECGMKFKNQSLLARHGRRHTNERPFVCEVCPKSFAQSGSLRAHMRSHTNEKPYYCRMCSKAYATSGTLLLHIRKAHNLAAKTVKEVFPVYKYIEDQKVFTIHSKPLAGGETIVNSDGTLGSVQTEKSNAVVMNESMPALTSAQTEEETTVSSVVNDSVDTTVTIPNDNEIEASRSLTENVQQEIVVRDEETITNESSDVTNAEASKLSDGGSMPDQMSSMTEHTESITGDVLAAAVITLGDIWQTPHEDGGDLVQVAAEVDVSSHSLHSAKDRQEAAIGLAELSLCATNAPDTAGQAQEQAQEAKTKTFFKEEEEDENDPRVTKIILSKEGGTMNSQDPHQCPVCYRIFGRKSIMIEHLRIHTDEKPYECDFCTAAFRQNAQLRSHIRNRHTKEKKYQCSFCHNRFLSRSITIRHIKFHHKLKMKFCKDANPDWSVEMAVWCDDKFEFNIEDPQFLKVNKQEKTTSAKKSKKVKTIEAGGNDSTAQLQLTQLDQKFVLKVSESGGLMCVPDTSHLADNRGVRDEDNVLISDEQAIDNTTSSKSMQLKDEATDMDYLDSALICGTCKMQFDSVTGLQLHLRDIHNTTLAQSDVSYVYEDFVNQEQGEVGNSVVIGHNTEQINGDKFVTEESQEGKKYVLLAGSKVESYHDSKVEARDEKDILINCRVCSEAFCYRDDLDQHMKSHSDEDVERVGMHRCDTCSLAFKNTQEVAKHIQRCHGVPRIFICSICKKEFYQESSVYRHMKFFHKWEIKIRGEANIPVIVKPAPINIHKASVVSTSGYTLPRARVERKKATLNSVNDFDRVFVNSAQSSQNLVNLEICHEENKELIHHESIESESTKVDKQGPSYIIVKDGSLSEDGDTQKIVDRLMDMFRSRSEQGEGKKGKFPQAVKVTAVGDNNIITELDISEAFEELQCINGEVNDLDGNAKKYEGYEALENIAAISASPLIPNAACEIVNITISREEEAGFGKKDCNTMLGGNGEITQVASKAIVLNDKEKTENTIPIPKYPCTVDDAQPEPAKNVESSQLLDMLVPSDVKHDENDIPYVTKQKDNTKDTPVQETNAHSIESENKPAQETCLQLIESETCENNEHQSSCVSSKEEKVIAGEEGESIVSTPKKQTNINKLPTTSTLKNSPGQTSNLVSEKTRTSPRSENKLDDSKKLSPGRSIKRKSKNADETETDKKTQKSLIMANAKMSDSAQKASVKMSDSAQKASVTMSDSAQKASVKMPDSAQKASVKMSDSAQKGNTKMTDSAQKANAKMSDSAQKGKTKVRTEPVVERRSSSGRLIKRKTFGDDVHDMSPLTKVRR